MDCTMEGKHKDWSIKRLTQVHEEYNTEFQKKLKILEVLEASINDTFCFKEAESAEERINKTFSTIRDFIISNLDESLMKLK